MFYRKKTYEIEPDMLETFNDFFHHYLYPNQLKHGAELVGRWTTDDHRKIYAIWAYKSKADYDRIENEVRHDPMHKMAQEKRGTLPELFITSKHEYLEATGDYDTPKHIVCASGAIFNNDGELLLVKTFWRDDTWELPGGQVEEGEGLEEAVKREIIEESGIIAEIDGFTGVYQNMKRGIINVVFKGRAVGGSLQKSDETKDVGFFNINAENINAMVTRPHFKERVSDALGRNLLPFKTYYPGKNQ